VRKWALPVVLGLLLVVAFVLGSQVREQLGFSLSLEGLADLREWVEGLTALPIGSSHALPLLFRGGLHHFLLES
jgi:hypothetical protein